MTGYKILKKISQLEILSHLLTHSLTRSLTTVASLEPKRSSAWSPFYATTTNSSVGCTFWGSDKCAPCAPCLSFYLQSGWLSSSSSIETIPGINFPYQHFSVDITKLFQKALMLLKERGAYTLQPSEHPAVSTELRLVESQISQLQQRLYTCCII